ncbi:MAG: NAD(P)H-binding protein [Deltaproteobacteria bacterium]|jgi:uncharacterized protein YbjT (DUF2867 family)|nr:NAD(P)H-binding protein [Deltaproteobacteria bacterium]
MDNLLLTENDRVLILGASGFVGRRLAKALAEQNIKLRLLSRHSNGLADLNINTSDVQVVTGDLVQNVGLNKALRDIHTTYYLVHSLKTRPGSSSFDYARADQIAAQNFQNAANRSGLKRVIYLGGLGEMNDGLSAHLKSRAEVANILTAGEYLTTVLRAAIIIGAGGASFEMLRYLVERLPFMVCSNWVNSRIQPIAIRDVLDYLIGCLHQPETADQRFDIGGPDVLTYKTLIDQYVAARGIAQRVIITVPGFPAKFTAWCSDLLTPIPASIAHPLVEGLKNEVVCRDDRISKFIPLKRTPFRDAVKIAFAEENKGPGVTGF